MKQHERCGRGCPGPSSRHRDINAPDSDPSHPGSRCHSSGNTHAREHCPIIWTRLQRDGSDSDEIVVDLAMDYADATWVGGDSEHTYRSKAIVARVVEGGIFFGGL